MGMDGTSPSAGTSVAAALLVRPFRDRVLYLADMPFMYGRTGLCRGIREAETGHYILRTAPAHRRILDNLALVFPAGGRTGASRKADIG
jgi:hypothetical protein